MLPSVPNALADTQLGAGAGHHLAETINEFGLKPIDRLALQGAR
jgi:hypothetical protein